MSRKSGGEQVARGAPSVVLALPRGSVVLAHCRQRLCNPGNKICRRNGIGQLAAVVVAESSHESARIGVAGYVTERTIGKTSLPRPPG